MDNIYFGDCRESLRVLLPSNIQTCVTSAMAVVSILYGVLKI